MKALDGIDYITKQMMVEQTNNDNYLSKLRNLGVEIADPYQIIKMLSDYTPALIDREDYRELLYSFLKSNELSGVRNLLRHLCFIPVKPRTNDSTRYIRWQKDLYVDDTTEQSPESYWVLDTKQLAKDDLEEILSVSVNVMDDRYRQALYREELEQHLYVKDLRERYHYFDNEFKRNRSKMERERSLLIGGRERIPLITEDNHYTAGKLFLCNLGEHYYSSPILQEYIVVKKCEPFAKFLEFADISTVTFEDLNINAPLTADDVEAFLDRNLKYGWMILSDCIQSGLVDDSLVEQYSLDGLRKTDLTEEYEDCEFPKEPVENLQRLIAGVRRSIGNVRKMTSEEVMQTVPRILLPDGTKQSLDTTAIRNRTINRYRPEENSSVCYCQACLDIKPDSLIEVNNIAVQPRYYWPQMRIALCLNCSKKFENLRRIDSVREDFFDALRNTNIQSPEPIEIPIGNMYISFTQTHLAELQEILKSEKY